MRPRVEQKIMISLPKEVRTALEKATKDLFMDAEEIVTDILKQWLYDQGYQ